MEMEVDEANSSLVTTPNKNFLFLWFVSKKSGLKKNKLLVDFDGLSLDTLKSAVVKELGSWEWKDENEKPLNVDILYRSRILNRDDEVKKVGPMSVITAIKRDVSDEEENHKSPKFIADYAASRNINDQIHQVAIALRTAFMSPKFTTMIENLGNSEKLENIFAIAPELKNDPIGIGIIQDPTLIYHLSDPESLKKIASSRPWVIEAFNFLAASIHQERGGGQPQGIPSHLFNPAMFDGDDEEMDDGEDDEGGAGPSRGGSGSRITREQLAAALSALGGGGALPTPGLPSSNAFGGLFQPAAPPPRQSPASSGPNAGVATAGANIQNLMNTLAGAGGAMPGQPLNSETVARAVTDALNRLTPEQRADQLNAIRNFATQLQQQSAGSQPPSATPPAPPTQASPRPQESSSLAQQYQSQLRQMRDLGITDERLSILALRVSEGDVNTAAELVFSGWQGEGSDPMN
ncbi:Ubiquitin-like protein 7 [Orchesella cincta]|uniref:Ubiquitin-like protein 7 n=1 Tax=Orchesella cincta TaxID=48709 RepID=A0A1D2NKL2_ORCCI|nr:Ubiquitin-like protein 7 [Orchesella cincta]